MNYKENEKEAWEKKQKAWDIYQITKKKYTKAHGIWRKSKDLLKAHKSAVSTGSKD